MPHSNPGVGNPPLDAGSRGFSIYLGFALTTFASSFVVTESRSGQPRASDPGGRRLKMKYDDGNVESNVSPVIYCLAANPNQAT